MRSRVLLIHLWIADALLVFGNVDMDVCHLRDSLEMATSVPNAMSWDGVKGNYALLIITVSSVLHHNINPPNLNQAD